MNIFFLHSNPQKAALLYCDEHLGKIRLEASQMLSTAYHLSKHINVEEKNALWFVNNYRIYNKAFVNHPTSVWVRLTQDNFNWCFEHLKALQKIWLSAGCNGDITTIMIASFGATSSLLRLPIGLSNVPLAMYDSVKQKYKPKEPMPVAVRAYREYMCAKVFKNDKRPTWTINQQPEWYHATN